MDDVDPILTPEGLPDPADVASHLDAWWAGDQERDEVRAWAAGLVDQALFPDLAPADPRAAGIELVLQLASDLPLARADIPAMRAFLLGGEDAWAAWYAYLGSRDWLTRKKRGWRPGT